MNPQEWFYPASPFYPSAPYLYMPYHPSGMLNSSVQTSLNSSSGYESASAETSLVDRCSISPVQVSTRIFEMQHRSLCISKACNVNASNKRPLDESDPEEYEGNEHVRKKRRVLSRPQRQEANRRERERMEIINHAYEQLRNVLPFKKGRKRQKMSRMDTVEGAIRYIHSLLETLHGPNYDPNWAC